jgi:hypothetical protein
MTVVAALMSDLIPKRGIIQGPVWQPLPPDIEKINSDNIAAVQENLDKSQKDHDFRRLVRTLNALATRNRI